MAVNISPGSLFKGIKQTVCFIQRRNRVKTKWAGTRAKLASTELALQHFDATYSLQLGDLWPSVRCGLLSEKKYGALVNNFAFGSDVVSGFHSKGCRDFISSALTEKLSTGSTEPTEPCNHTAAQISSNLQCFIFPRGDISRFKPARPATNGLLSYYLLDAASVLPVLALDVQPGHSVLDLCAGPGGKTLALLQNEALGFLWANDLSETRSARLHRTLRSYLPRELLEDKVQVTSLDGRQWRHEDEDIFDKVLVDVPCTTDRHSLMEEENNIFKRSRTKERQMLPLLQIELLLAGIQAARPGGEVVYSTCSLSRLQNECVVQQALSVAQEEMGVTVEVQSLSSLVQLFTDTFHFAPQPLVGELVLPHLCANFGPIYMCKLRRLS